MNQNEQITVPQQPAENSSAAAAGAQQQAKAKLTKGAPVAQPDSVAADTVAVGEAVPVLVIDAPKAPTMTVGKADNAPEQPALGGYGNSFITLGLLLIFCVLGITFRNNPRYLAAIRRDLFETRERGNVFDDTVSESVFLLIMNILWVASAGVLLAYGVRGYEVGWAGIAEWSPGWLSVVGCMGVAAAYTLFIWCAYNLTGNIFATPQQTRMWTRAFAAAQGLTGVGFFLIALIVECYPALTMQLLIAAAVIFVIFRLIFIFKGILIFFNKFSSWMIFLCYLCNLEIVPLILTFVAAILVCHAT